ncbi:hypothetical protein D9758_018491 [Tetrapyrgos nigripes]|uniref:Cytochrome P450 n=1 Tax=Tetrapyrgos nigripes TaxID=182062 RepID=A0A8H5ARL6_9AGAR|nr:hypothetical protein D9758_018491 [Tetrapyrgos nigripes]
MVCTFHLASFLLFTIMRNGSLTGSDIIHLDLLGTPLIVVNSLKAATELFEKRSSNYSDRPRFTMLFELQVSVLLQIGMNWNIGLMPYGDLWRACRKGFHQELNPRALVTYHPSITSATQKLLLLLLDKPDDFLKHLRYMAGNTILSIAYGIEVQPENDPFINIAEKALHAAALTVNSGSYLVDQLPALKHIPDWFPGAGFKRQAREWNKDMSAMAVVPLEFVKGAMSKGDFTPSVASRSLEKLASEPSSTAQRQLEAEKVLQAGLVYAGGADSTASTLGTFIHGLVQNPDAMRKGQIAVDERTGGARLADFSDFGSIPYVDALLRETLRWIPLTPLSVPHRSVEDDEYNGYYIPGGATVVGNGWAMLHDESVYGPNPHIFNPERFLQEDGSLDPNVPFPNPAFGFGRRLCAGTDLAISAMWMAIACILACFDVTQVVDENGNEIEPNVEYTLDFMW